MPEDDIKKLTIEDLLALEELINKIDPEKKVFDDTCESINDLKKVLGERKKVKNTDMDERINTSSN